MRILLALLLAALVVPGAGAQTIWPRPYVPNQIAVETIAPDTPGDASWLSGATFLTGTGSLNENVEVVGELPVARFGGTAGVSSSTALGNPYLGLGFSSTKVPVLVEVGARLPVASAGRAGRIGARADMGRLSAFRPDGLSLSGLLNGRVPVGRNTSLRLRSGIAFSSFSVPTATGDSTASAWHLQYDAQLWREGERTITGLTFTGRAALISPSGTRNAVALSVMGNWTGVQPGLVVGTSVNDLALDGTLTPFAGLTLSISYTRL